jgi:hypothetical protein
MNNEWSVKLATLSDFGNWMLFVKSVQKDFHNLDLYNDDGYQKVIQKNIKRGTAIFVKNELNTEIIGAMIYSPNS